MESLEFRVAELERRLANVMRLGLVEQLDEDAARVRVRVGDILTAWIPWVAHRAGGDRTWWAPEPGEQVVLLAPAGELAAAVALPAVYRSAYAPPANAKTVHRTTYADGAVIEYDREAHKLTATIPGDVELTADGDVTVDAGGSVAVSATSVSITASNVEIDGSCTITGDLNVDGTVMADTDVIAGTVSLKTHVHGGVQAGSGSTSPPT